MTSHSIIARTHIDNNMFNNRNDHTDTHSRVRGSPSTATRGNFVRSAAFHRWLYSQKEDRKDLFFFSSLSIHVISRERKKKNNQTKEVTPTNNVKKKVKTRKNEKKKSSERQGKQEGEKSRNTAPCTSSLLFFFFTPATTLIVYFPIYVKKAGLSRGVFQCVMMACTSTLHFFFFRILCCC